MLITEKADIFKEELKSLSMLLKKSTTKVLTKK